MSNAYFTSDTHLGHRAAASRRDFSSVAEHDAHVVYSLMQPLNKNDVLWVLGDIAWSVEALPGLHTIPCQMKAVLGNHDKLPSVMYMRFFRAIYGAVRYKNMWLTHIPIHEQAMHRCLANVHGHTHKGAAAAPLDFPYINVNWDFWRRPVSLDEIQELIREKAEASQDNHTASKGYEGASGTKWSVAPLSQHGKMEKKGA